MSRKRMSFVFSLSLFISGFLLTINNQTFATASKQNLSFSHASNTNLQDSLLRQGYIAVPLRKGADGYLYMEASFGNYNHYPLELDTGAGHTTLDPKIMNIFNFKMTGKTTMGGGGDRNAGLYHEVTIPSLRLGNFITYHETAYIANHSFSPIKLNRQTTKAGMLGISFLRAHSAVIDVKNQFLYLKPAGDNHSLLRSSASNQTIFLDAKFKSMKLERSPHNFIMLNASINDATSQKFFLDSGSLTLLSLSYIKQQGLPLTPIENGKGSGGGIMRMFITPINKLSVGTINWFPRKVLVTDFKYIQNGFGRPLAGVIGIDWMRAHDAIIDMGSDRILIR